MKKTLTVSSLALGAALFAYERDAQACGGCFAPQENPTVVTDHRMVMTIGRNESTLYDQIRYTGSPASFAWVLPIAGEVKVGLSADVVFQGLDQQTQTRIQAPPQNCPPPPNCDRSSFSGASDRNEGASPQDPGVQVTKRETVGPYDTVQLKATDPQALDKWLTQNGFSVPPVVKPVIAQYVTEHFDFLALKLLPGKDVTDMRPVRVTTPGANVVLPLRMVAAGTGANVGITLWTLAEGRYAPQNFPTFAILADEIEWDWTSSKSTYADLRAAKTLAGQGKAWEIESSTTLQRDQLTNSIRYGGGQDAYLPVKDQGGAIIKSAEEVREDDVAALIGGIGGASIRVTRIRADLAQAALATDLALAATADQSELATLRVVTREKNQPLCPIYSGCEQVGTAPRDVAAAQQSGNNESFSCAVEAGRHVPSNKAPLAWLAVGAAALGIVITRASRERLRKR